MQMQFNNLQDLFFRRRIHEVEPQHVFDAQRLEIQHCVGQVNSLDLRDGFVHHIVEALLRVQPIALARSCEA